MIPELRFEKGTRTSIGLASVLGGEVTVRDPEQSEAVEAAFIAMLEHFRTSGRVPDADFYFGAWELHIERNEDTFTICERDISWAAWVPGIRVASEWWSLQRRLADAVGSGWAPALGSQLVAVSEGVFEGAAVEGVRYRAPEHMSGWYLTTDLYNGNTDSLSLHHLYHVGVARPDLIPYLGLAPGFCFDQKGAAEPYFDAEVAAEDPE